MKIKVEVDFEEVINDILDVNDDGKYILGDNIKSSLIADIKSKIVKDIHNMLHTDVNNLKKGIIEGLSTEWLEGEITRHLTEQLNSPVLTWGRYHQDKELVTVQQYVRKTLEDTDERKHISEKANKIVMNLADETLNKMYDRYDVMFATNLIVNLKNGGFLNNSGNQLLQAALNDRKDDNAKGD